MTRPLTVQAHMGLVHSIAKRYARACSHLELEDLIQEGVFGLMKALERFEPERGFAFSTYASHWIAHHIRRAVTDQDRTVRIPVHRCEKMHRRGELTRERLASFEAPLRDDCGGCLHDVLPSDGEPADERVERLEREALARAALEVLDERHRSVISARVWDEQTLAQVGDAMPVPVSRERIRQLEAVALAELRRRTPQP